MDRLNGNDSALSDSGEGTKNAVTPQTSIEEITRQLQAAAAELNAEPPATAHAELLEQLLAQVRRVDFSAEAGKGENEPVPLPDIAVIVCHEVERLAKANNWQMCQREGFFWLYNGCYWQKVTDPEMERFLGLAAKGMSLNELTAERFTFREVLRKQFSASGYLPEPPAQTDGGVKINLKNGTLAIGGGGGKISPFNPDDFLRYQMPFGYDPQAKAPLWHKFLGEVLPDESLQAVLCEMLAYTFIPKSVLKLEKCLFLYGSGANGKSVVFEVISALLGRENVSNYSITSLTDRNGYYRAELSGKLLNYASEISGDMEAALFKQLVSGEPIEARLPYRDPQIISNYAKLVFNANRLPDVPEFTHAFFRRFVIIPFDVTIAEARQDRDLPQKIISAELPGVLNWILGGLSRLTENRCLSASEAVSVQVANFRTESDTVSLFINEKIEDGELARDIDGSVTVKWLYALFAAWSRENGYRQMSNRSFTGRMKAIGFESERNNAERLYSGINIVKT